MRPPRGAFYARWPGARQAAGCALLERTSNLDDRQRRIRRVTREQRPPHRCPPVGVAQDDPARLADGLVRVAGEWGRKALVVLAQAGRGTGRAAARETTLAVRERQRPRLRRRRTLRGRSEAAAHNDDGTTAPVAPWVLGAHEHVPPVFRTCGRVKAGIEEVDAAVVTVSREATRRVTPVRDDRGAEVARSAEARCSSRRAIRRRGVASHRGGRGPLRRRTARSTRIPDHDHNRGGSERDGNGRDEVSWAYHG